MIPASISDPLSFGSNMNDIQKFSEKEMLKKLMINQDYTLQNESLNLQDLTPFDDPDDEKYDDGNKMSIRELKKRQYRRLSSAAKKKDGHGDDKEKAHHDTTNEDIGLFMLICMLSG